MQPNQTIDFHERVRSGENVLSYSQIACWMSCRQQWWYRYGLRMKKRIASDPLILGDMVHQAVAAFFESSQLKPDEPYSPELTCHDITERFVDSIKALDDRFDPEPYYDIRDNAAQLAWRVIEELDRRKLEPLNDETGLWIERELTTPIPGFDHFAGHIDMLAVDPWGLVWLIDFKVRGQFSPISYEEVNLQHLIYAYLCRLNGVHVDGTVTLEIKNKMPSPPKINKDGMVSRVYSGDWDTYEKFLREHGQIVDLYLDMKPKLDSNRFVNFMAEPRTEHTMEQVWQQVVLNAASEIAAAQDLIKAGTKAPFVWRALKHFNCNGCGERNICLSSLRNDDVDTFLPEYDVNPDILRYAKQEGWL